MARTRACSCSRRSSCGFLSLAAWAVIPIDERLGDRQYQCRHPLYFRDFVALASMASSWAAGRRIRNIRSCRRCVRRRRWSPTKSRSASCMVTVLLCVGSLNLEDIVKAQDTRFGLLRLVLAAAVADVRDLLRLGSGGDEPAAVRSRRGGVGTRRRFHGRIFFVALHALHARRIRGDHHHVRAGDDPVSGRLAIADPAAAVHLDSGRRSGSS